MYFIDNVHKDFYKKIMGQVTLRDCYSDSLIYLLSSNNETRKYFNDIYNIKNNEINIESLKEPWQTSTSLNICRLGFNLFGDIVSDEYDGNVMYSYTVNSIFKNLDLECGIQALKIRATVG